MIDIAPFDVEHLNYLEPRLVYHRDVSVKERMRIASSDSNRIMKTYLVKGDPIAVVGLLRLFEHTYELFGLTSDRILMYPISFVRTTRRLLDDYASKLNIWRYQVFVSIELSERAQFMRALGFMEEGFARRYGPNGEAHYLYGRIY